MQYSDSIDATVQDCRFVLATRDLEDLLPGALGAVPPFATIEYLDSPRESAVVGLPVRQSAAILGDLVRLVLTQLGRALKDPDYQEPVDSLTATQLRDDPWCRQLTRLLTRSLAHGARARLDSVVWLLIADVVAGVLNHHEPTLETVRRLLPDEARKGERYIQDLLRQKGASTARHARTKNVVLRSVFARNDFAMSSVSEVLGEAYANPLWREMVANRLVFSEKPGGLHSFFDLRELFAVRSWRIEAEDFADLQRVVRLVVEDAYRRAGAGRASAAESWLVGRFATDLVLEKAGRLDVADATSSMSFEGEDFPSRVAWLLSLQPQVVEYVVAHGSVLNLSKAVGRKEDIRKEFRSQLKTPAGLAPLLPGFQDVQRAVLKWDFFSALRGRLLDVREQDGRLMHGDRQLRASASPLDLDSPGRLRDARRHGTVVAVDLGRFSRNVGDQIEGREGEPAPDPDFAALCLRQLMAIRRNLGVFRGRAESFADGVVVDVFPRALDALRYVTLFQAAAERTRLLREAPWEEARANPFGDGLRAGMSTGGFVDLALPGRGPDESVASRWFASGPLMQQARGLVTSGGEAAGSSVSDSQMIQAQLSGVHDPLQVYAVHTAGGRLDNRGLVSFARTFTEVVAAVRLEGLPVWTPTSGATLIAGRRVVLKNYRFELIFDDPATGRIVLVREVENPPKMAARPEGGEGLYEYVVLWPDAFQTFIDRVMELERHQPVMGRRSREVSAPRPSGAAPRPSSPASSPAPPKATAPRVPSPAPSAHDAPAPGFAMGVETDLGALNLPGADDFQFPDSDAASDLEARLGLSLDEDGLGAFGARGGEPTGDGIGWDISGDLALPAVEDTGPDPGLNPAPDLGLLDHLGGSPDPDYRSPFAEDHAADGVVAGFNFDATGEHAGLPTSPLERMESGGVPRHTDELMPLGRPTGLADETADDVTGYEMRAIADSVSQYELDRVSASMPAAPDASGSAPLPKGPRSPSLLGRLDGDIFERILELEGRARRPTARPSRETALREDTPPGSAPPRDSEASMPALQRAWTAEPEDTSGALPPERLEVPRPDFHVLFRDYVTFWVGPEGEKGSWLAVGRRYRDVFFDLHRFDPPPGGAGWGVEQALQEFLRGKIRENFVPQSLSYEELPHGAGARVPVDVEQLERAFAAIT